MPNANQTHNTAGPTLVVVESPTKAKTLAAFLGAGFIVEATKGHIYELTKVSPNANYQTLRGLRRGAVPVMQRILQQAKLASLIVLATDDDREGESIAEDVRAQLAAKLPNTPIVRAAFHQITKDAVTAALAAPRQVDQAVVWAQRTRQSLDWVVGKHLSAALAAQVAGYRFNKQYASGRVQAPALTILVDRETARRNFTPAPFEVVEVTLTNGLTAVLTAVNGSATATDGAHFDAAGVPLGGRLVLHKAQVAQWLPSLGHAQLVVTASRTTQRKESPKPPFTTATLLAAASSRLGLSPDRTMSVAQALYETGLITYMRTDSSTLSAQAVAAAGVEIRALGQQPVPRATSSAAHSQGAHEAIRPAIDSAGAFVSKATVLNQTGKTEADLFALIWDRTVASQMADAVSDVWSGQLSTVVGSDALTFSATHSSPVSPGFRSVWVSPTTHPAYTKWSVGQQVPVASAKQESLSSSPPQRLSEAGLIKAMVAAGVGRPSTYASTLKKLLDKRLVRRSLSGRSLEPTARGVLVVEALRAMASSAAAPGMVDMTAPAFTAALEVALDSIVVSPQPASAYLSQLQATFGPATGPGLLAALTGWGVASPLHRNYVLGVYVCPAVPSNCGGHALELRAGTGMRHDYAYCAGCLKRATLPAAYSYGDTDDTTVSAWVHTRQDRLLGSHGDGELWVCYGEESPYVEARSGDGTRETWSLPETVDPRDFTYEEAVEVVQAPRIPRALGEDEATGFPVWVRYGKDGDLVVEFGPDASSPMPRSREARKVRRTVVVPLPVGADGGIVLDDVQDVLRGVKEAGFPESWSEQRKQAGTGMENCDITAEAIKELLEVAVEPMSARHIARILCGSAGKQTRGQVNRVLYENPSMFAKDDNTVPGWRLV